jgi:probable HAF family extracellular repeat protein
MVGLGSLPGGRGGSDAFGVSADGSVVVGQAGGNLINEAFRWTSAGGMVGLGSLPGDDLSTAYGASAGGSVVVGSSCPASGPCKAFIWDAVHGVRSVQQVLTNDFGLNLAGWSLGGASAVSPDGGAIVGSGTDPSGKDEAWLAVIPEPGTGLLVSMGLMCLVVARMHPSV